MYNCIFFCSRIKSFDICDIPMCAKQNIQCSRSCPSDDDALQGTMNQDSFVFPLDG
jgi:hypothetical protein